jgi:heptosyltransferase-2
MLDFSIYLLYRAGSAMVSALPFRFLFLVGQFFGFCGWIFLGKYRRLAWRNLQIAFGNEKTPREMRRLVRRHFQSLCANLLCGVKLSAMPLEKAAARMEVENVDAVHRELRRGQPVILVLSHLSNWELIAQLLPRWIGYVRNSTVYQKLGNRYIDAHVRQMRSRAGVELFDRSEGFHKATELLRGGGAIGILSDQHAGDHGLWTPFFGRLASTSPLPGLLAKRTGAALIAAAVRTDGPARWRLIFTSRFDKPGDSVKALTARGNEMIARQIRAAPEDWFWVHNRWKTPKPNFLLSRYKRGVFVPPEISPEDLKPFRILIRAPNWLGDSVISVPAVRGIKTGRPDAHITIAAPAKIAPTWKLVPEVDEILAIPEQSLFATVRLLHKQSPFDVAIVFPNSIRVALEVWLAGIRHRVGYRGRHRSWLLNQIVRERSAPGPVEHQAKRYLRIADELGAPPSSEEIAREHRGALPSGDRIKIGLCPGAEYGPAKRWLPERFAEAASALATQLPVQWILFGTVKDAQIGEGIATSLGENCVNRIGQTTLEQLIEELRECRLLLTNDTGTMHLATLIGVPVVAIFGSTEPRLTGPLGQGNFVLRHQVECSPCFLRECPIDFRCMRAITVEEVIAAVQSALHAHVAASL